MAMTATISVAPSTQIINQPVEATLTISNSGSAAVTVTSIEPTTILTSAGINGQNTNSGRGRVNLGPGGNISVASSGSQVYKFDLVFFTPSTGMNGSGSNTYDCGAVCQSNDGSIFKPTVTTVTINPVPLISTEL